MKKLSCLLVFALTIVFGQNNFGQDLSREEEVTFSSEYPRHSIDLRLGFWDQSSSEASVSLKGLSVNVGTGGISGKIMYNYYPNSNYAFTFSVGMMSAEVEVKTLSNYTSTVAPLTMGLKYFFIQFDDDNTLRPYLSGTFGMLIGSETDVKLFSVGTHTETAVGGYAGIGTDIILGSLIKFNADFGYNLFSDFKKEIGSKLNYSGAEFSFGIGFMF